MSEFVPAIPWEEARRKQATSGSVVFMTFVVFSESKRIEKLRYMAGWPTCARVVFFNASETRVKNSGRLAAARPS